MDDWPELPATLIENDALDVEKRAARVARLHGVLRRVADDARAAILTPPSHEKTVCTTTPLFDDELQQLVQQAYDYYTQPAPEGAPYGGMPAVRRVRRQPGAACRRAPVVVEGRLSAANGAELDAACARRAPPPSTARLRDGRHRLGTCTTCFCLRRRNLRRLLFVGGNPSTRMSERALWGSAAAAARHQQRTWPRDAGAALLLRVGARAHDAAARRVAAALALALVVPCRDEGLAVGGRRRIGGARVRVGVKVVVAAVRVVVAAAVGHHDVIT